MKLLVVLYISHITDKCESGIQFSARCEDVLRNDGGDSMKIFLKDFLEALLTCVQLGIAVPILLIALLGPTALIIVAILWALGVI